ncbi:MAG: hypothetical protein Q7S58_08430 [Candidatus Binatus sp.]|uniref:hypothetical protein n=1 Tax=Candidatus Binatus sp. TaxID=2811406 RepID=UPI002727487D|nr:hypothetical protein [Candidatus Binatus sp.]MDO8432418.1 hypothetical protein [Candidatus Binatus sp.]
MFELESVPPERLELQLSPVAGTVASYVLTGAAERSWQILNQHLARPKGAVFWVGGPPGCGKTHFLNYAIALESRAGTLEAGNARRLICGFEASGPVNVSELEFYLLSAIAEPIGAEQRTIDLWREMRGVGALLVALENVRRIGVRALTVAIDFGLSSCPTLAEFIETLAQAAQRSTQVKFTVIAAGRESIGEPAKVLEVAAAAPHERVSVALRRVRKLNAAPSQIEQAYGGIECGGYDPQSIFPFHPSSLDAIGAIAGADPTITELSRVARAALEAAKEDVERLARLIYPADLTQIPSIEKLVERRLTPSAATALKIARNSIERFDRGDRELAREIVDALMLDNLRGEPRPAITLRDLASRVSMLAQAPADESWPMPRLRELIRQLGFYTGGIISLAADSVRFDPTAAGSPEVAAFNAALELMRRFDSSLIEARDSAELQARYRQLDAALGAAIERANRTVAALSGALAEFHLDLPPAHQHAIASFVAVAESGAAGLAAMSKDPAQRESAQKVCEAYEALADAAEAVPRIRSMRTFLADTGLRADSPDITWQDGSTAALETECELLIAELGPRLITGAIRNLSSVEARFHKFKWTYVQRYQAEHEKWRIEMDRLTPIAEDARRYSKALRLLDAIAALGPAEGAQFEERTAEIAARVVPCDPRHKPAPEASPLCVSCGFRLGAHSPREELADATDRLRRALGLKLDALSQKVIARLIRQYDKQHRLDGFLKIIQASQTDALVRLLDENLASYLAGILDEKTPHAASDVQDGTTQPRNAGRGKINRVGVNRQSDR